MLQVLRALAYVAVIILSSFCAVDSESISASPYNYAQWTTDMIITAHSRLACAYYFPTLI